jgi:hypothetical protein
MSEDDAALIRDFAERFEKLFIAQEGRRTFAQSEAAALDVLLGNSEGRASR